MDAVDECRRHIEVRLTKPRERRLKIERLRRALPTRRSGGRSASSDSASVIAARSPGSRNWRAGSEGGSRRTSAPAARRAIQVRTAPAYRPLATHRRRSAARARLCKEAGAPPPLLLALGEPPVAKSCMATEMATVRFIRAAGYFCCPDFS